MNGAISIFFSLIILAMCLVFSTKFLLQRRGINYLSSLVWIFVLSPIAFLAFDLAYKFQLFRMAAFFPLENCLILTFEFTYLALVIFVVLKEPDAKKMKTLMRLPLIGALLGWYLSYIHVAALFGLVEIAATFLLVKHSKSHPFYWRAHFKAFLPIPLLSMYSLPTNAFFLIFLLWSLFFKFSLVNAAIVKKAMVDYDRSLNNEK